MLNHFVIELRFGLFKATFEINDFLGFKLVSLFKVLYFLLKLADVELTVLYRF